MEAWTLFSALHLISHSNWIYSPSLAEKSPHHPKKAATHELHPLSPPRPPQSPSLLSEHWCGTKASQPEVPTSFGFNEVPMTPSHTSVRKFQSGKSHPGRWEVRADTGDDPQAISRPKDSALSPKDIASCSGVLPLHLRDVSLKESISNLGARPLAGKRRLLDWILQIPDDTSLSKSGGT